MTIAENRTIAENPVAAGVDIFSPTRPPAKPDLIDVERFQEMQASGTLRDPHEVARDLWRIVEQRPENGAVVDIRDARR